MIIGFIPIFEKYFDNMEFRELLSNFREEPLTRQVILSLLKDYKRPNDKISELVKSGWLISLKNGLYVPGPSSKVPRPELMLIANHLWGPSYVSMETALSYWGLIPERVYETASVTVKRSRLFKTELGRFSYRNSPLPYYSLGIRTIELSPRQAVMIGTPEKAICDKIIFTSGVNLRSVKQVLDFLVSDLRIDGNSIKNLDIESIQTISSLAPKKTSLQMLIKSISEL